MPITETEEKMTDKYYTIKDYGITYAPASHRRYPGYEIFIKTLEPITPQQQIERLRAKANKLFTTDGDKSRCTMKTLKAMLAVMDDPDIVLPSGKVVHVSLSDIPHYAERGWEHLVGQYPKEKEVADALSTDIEETVVGWLEGKVVAEGRQPRTKVLFDEVDPETLFPGARLLQDGYLEAPKGTIYLAGLASALSNQGNLLAGRLKGEYFEWHEKANMPGYVLSDLSVAFPHRNPRSILGGLLPFREAGKDLRKRNDAGFVSRPQYERDRFRNTPSCRREMLQQGIAMLGASFLAR